MKRTLRLFSLAGLLAALTINAGLAQGRGRGYGAQGKPCPYALSQPNPNAGGWWARVRPSDARQKAFVEDSTKLHAHIRKAQFDLRQLEATKADAKTLESKQAEIDALRSRLHILQSANRALKQQIMQGSGGGRGWGRGMAGQGMGRGRGMGRGMRPGCPFAADAPAALPAK
ncbi:MAG: hypothetical protein IT210_11580 [Armatimonadetes bacterium]|nr:hypothetical protein [Armatimonadota bacterium]